MLSAKSEDYDKITGLNSRRRLYYKAVQYPGSKARIKAIMRRTGRKEKDTKDTKMIVKGDLKLDCESRRVFSKTGRST